MYMTTLKQQLIKGFSDFDLNSLKTNERIYLLKVLFSYYEAVLSAYYGNGLFFLSSGIDDLNDYFKVLRKKLIELVESDEAFSGIKNGNAYAQVVEQITSLYSSAGFLDVIWDDTMAPSIINLREEIADKDLFENQSEIHKVSIIFSAFLDTIPPEIETMQKYLDKKTKHINEVELPKYKEALQGVFGNQEETEKKPKTKLSNYVISFDNETAKLSIGDFESVSFPSHTNQHYVLRKLFSHRKGEAIDWQEIYEDMTGTKSTTLKGEEIEKQKKSVKDAVRAINTRVKEVCNTDSELLLWETKCIKRLY